MKYFPKIIFTFISINCLLGHGVSESTASAMSNANLMDFIYFGGEHMVTGYDHILFLIGVLFFAYLHCDLYATEDPFNAYILTIEDSSDGESTNIVIKDNIDLEGFPTTAGSLAILDNIAKKDAFIVSNSSLDITNDILTEVNKNIKKID